MMRSVFRLLATAILWIGVAAAPAHAEKRVALVIGNADYLNAPTLANPIKDAGAVGDALTRLGFTVRKQSDLSFDAMRRTLNEFAREANGADIALIYYAGHGMEFDGQNYLVPVDAKLGTDVDVPYEAIPLNLTLGALDGARGTRLLILDACRDNPFKSTMKVGEGSRSIGRGLARIEPSVGTIVAYAAKEGTTAADGDAEHSPFAKALLAHIEEPGIDVQFLFRKVRDTVLEETDGKQEPFTYGSLPGRPVVLKPAEAPEAPAVAERATAPGGEQEIAAEVAFWNSIQGSNDRALYETYLKQYPAGRFASLATIFIARIDAEAKPPAKEPPPPADAAATPPATEPPPPAVDAAANPPATEPVPPPADSATTVPANEPAIGPVASLPPETEAGSGGAPVDPAADRDFVRNVQKELLRVGCYVGSTDGKWGKKSRAAVTAFAENARLTFASLDPTAELYAALKGQDERVCPLVCSARYEPSGDRCVLKVCPPGEKLTASGACVSSPPEVKREAPVKPIVKLKDKVKNKATGGCRVETEQQCIGRLESLGKSVTGLEDIQIATRCSNPARRIKVCK